MSLPPGPPPIPAVPYATAYRARPAAVSLLGVTSIIVASLSALATLLMALMALAFIAASRVATTAPMKMAPAVPLPPPNPRSMPSSERLIVTGAIMTRVALSPQKRAQLDALLDRDGRDIFPMTGQYLTPQTARANISDAGVLPSGTGGEGLTYVVIGSGRIELATTHALFRPTHGGEVVRVAASDMQDPLIPKPPPIARMTMPPPAPRRVYTISVKSQVLTLADAGLSLLLAALLLTAGIMTLRQSGITPLMYRIWALLKLLVAVLAAAGWMWLIEDLVNGSRSLSPSPAGPNLIGGLVFAALLLLLGWAYPVAVLIALHTRDVREYYRARVQ